ncbi:MAG: hypothetical protein QM770_12930 [Tepidisphaeraceae bacterium]
MSVWISLGRNDALSLSNPAWLQRLAVGCFILATAHGGWTMLCAAWGMSAASWNWWFWIGMPWEHVRVYTPLASMLLLTGMAYFVPGEGRWPDKGEETRVGVIVGMVIVGVLLGIESLIAWWTDTFWVFWLLQGLSPLIVLFSAMTALLHVGNRLQRGGRHGFVRLMWKVNQTHVGAVVLAVFWIPLLFLRMSWPLQAVFSRGSYGIGFSVVMFAHAVLSLAACACYAWAGRRFLKERAEAIAAWAQA